MQPTAQAVGQPSEKQPSREAATDNSPGLQSWVLAARLRFNSVKDRLNLPDPDCTNGQQLQTMRELTPETASMLQTVLHSNGKHGGTT
jgi:hypothetical protein